MTRNSQGVEEAHLASPAVHRWQYFLRGASVGLMAVAVSAFVVRDGFPPAILSVIGGLVVAFTGWADAVVRFSADVERHHAMLEKYGLKYSNRYDRALATRGSLRLVFGNWFEVTRKELVNEKGPHS